MIVPTQAHADGTVDVVCEQCTTGSQVKTLAITQVAFGAYPSCIVLVCPTCNSSSSHPLQGDGRCRLVVRDLFARTVQRLGSPDGKCAAGDFAAAQAYISSENTTLGGPPKNSTKPAAST